MSDSKTITALEIGTGKMQVFIGEVVDDKLLNFIGSGQAATEGVKKADIVDIRRAASQAQAAIVMAERSASAQIKSVCLGISGTHIKGFRNVGSANVSGADGVVRREDVERAKEDARTKSLAEGRSYIHRICCGYYVDDKFCTNPLGLSGRRVDAEYWMMHGDNDRIASAIHAVESFGIEVEHLVFSGIASALAVTSPQQKIDGVLCVDIGCGTSDYAYYRHGHIVQAGVIPVGGDHITNDLSFGIRLTRKNSERVKIHCGKANLSEDERGMQFWSLGDKQIGDKKIPLDAVNRIIRARLEEFFIHELVDAHDPEEMSRARDGRAAVHRLRLTAEFAAGERTGQKVGSHREAVALVPSHRQQAAEHRLFSVRRIVSVHVHRPAERDLLALSGVNAYLPLRGGACRGVYRKIAVLASGERN